MSEATLAGRHLTDLAHPLDFAWTLLDVLVAFPDKESHDAVALWVAYTHAADWFTYAPRLLIDSPEPGCGKTLVIDIAGGMVKSPYGMADPSPASLYQYVGAAHARGQGCTTVLWDETDTVFGNGAGKDTEALRAFVNTGFKRGIASKVTRGGEDGKPVAYETHSPIMLAGIDNGAMPETVLQRSIRVTMLKPTPEQRARLMDYDDATDIWDSMLDSTRQLLAAWIDMHDRTFGQHLPTIPNGIHGRTKNLWRPLLTIAELAGGTWPERARAAAVKISGEAQEDHAETGNIVLDALDVWPEHQAHLSGAELHDRLLGHPSGRHTQWTLTTSGMQRELRKFKLRTKDTYIGSSGLKRYHRTDFAEVARRYPSAPPAEMPAMTAIPAIPQVGALREAAIKPAIKPAMFIGEKLTSEQWAEREANER